MPACGTISAAQTYAQSDYYGILSPTFVASTEACGHQVSATVTIAFNAVVKQVNVPLSAMACFSLGDNGWPRLRIDNVALNR